MSSEREMICSEKFQDAIDRLCDEQKKCTKDIVETACDIWSKAMICYVMGVTKGIGGIFKCYIVGVECFYKTLETLTEELCDKRGKEVRTKSDMPSEPTQEKLSEMKAIVAKAELHDILETAAQDLGKKKGNKAVLDFYTELKAKAEDLGDKKGFEAKVEFYKTLQDTGALLGIAKGKEAQARFYTSLRTEVTRLYGKLEK